MEGNTWRKVSFGVNFDFLHGVYILLFRPFLVCFLMGWFVGDFGVRSRQLIGLQGGFKALDSNREGEPAPGKGPKRSSL